MFLCNCGDEVEEEVICDGGEDGSPWSACDDEDGAYLSKEDIGPIAVVPGGPRPFDVIPDGGVREEPYGDVSAVPNQEEPGLVTYDGPDERRVSFAGVVHVEPCPEEHFRDAPLFLRDRDLDEFLVGRTSPAREEEFGDVRLSCAEGGPDEFLSIGSLRYLWQNLPEEEALFLEDVDACALQGRYVARDAHGAAVESPAHGREVAGTRHGKKGEEGREQKKRGGRGEGAKKGRQLFRPQCLSLLGIALFAVGRVWCASMETITLSKFSPDKTGFGCGGFVLTRIVNLSFKT